MSRPKSPERILLDQERAIRRERREQKRIERETKRAARELKAKAKESYDAKNGGDHEMRRSEFTTSGCARCHGFGIATKWLPGVGSVCPECFDHCDFDGRATPAEPGTTAVVQPDQLAPPENSGPEPDLLGQGKELGGERRVAQLALFES